MKELTVKEAVEQLIKVCEKNCAKNGCPFVDCYGNCILYAPAIGEIPAFWPYDLGEEK